MEPILVKVANYFLSEVSRNGCTTLVGWQDAVQ